MQAASRQLKQNLKLSTLVLVALAGAGAVWGIVIRNRSQQELGAWATRQAAPPVSVTYPSTDLEARTLELPGQVQAYYEAPLYARVSGYVKIWYKDIGDRVKKDDILATIDTPDLDQELARAKADLTEAHANAALAAVTAKRWRDLVASHSVSVQSADEKEAGEQAMHATEAAQAAHLEQLLAEKKFADLRAPFDGIVTARTIDIGALTVAGSVSTQALFKVADLHKIRLYVHVPQIYANELTQGLQVDFTLPQYGSEKFTASLVATSHEIADESRTVLAELQADNPSEKLWPGNYASVSFHLPPDKNCLRVPATALIFRDQGAQLAVVGDDNRVIFKKITIARNLGDEIEVSAGISPHDRVVVAPFDTLSAGDRVEIEPAHAGGGA